jgi:hypothetical protein
MKALEKLVNWFHPRDRRKAAREETLPLIAHYWDGGPPVPRRVRDISPNGLYLMTDQRWYPGSLVMLSLQREDLPESNPHRTITVKAKVVRLGEDGVGFSMVHSDKAMSESGHHLLPGGAEQKKFERFVATLLADQGQVTK